MVYIKVRRLASRIIQVPSDRRSSRFAQSKSMKELVKVAVKVSVPEALFHAGIRAIRYLSRYKPKPRVTMIFVYFQ